MARISAAIMAHPSRGGLVVDLRNRLDRDVPEVWDRCNNRIDTGFRAMASYDPSATHHLVLQDDVIPCGDLLATLEQALDYVPPLAPVSLYAGRVDPFIREMRRARTPTSWLRMKHVNWGQGIVVPTATLPRMLEWVSSGPEQNYDARVGSYYTAHDQWCWYPWPSLVQHRDEPSLIGHGQKRHAMSFLGEDISGLKADFSGPVFTVTATRRQK